VQVSAFYGGSSSLPTTTDPGGPEVSRAFPAAGSCQRAPFQGLFKAARTTLARARERITNTEWIQACKAGKKSIMPIRDRLDFTEFALLRNGHAATVTARPGSSARTGWGRNGPVGLRGRVEHHREGAHPGVYDPRRGPSALLAKFPRCSCGTRGREVHNRTKWPTATWTRPTARSGTTKLALWPASLACPTVAGGRVCRGAPAGHAHARGPRPHGQHQVVRLAFLRVTVVADLRPGWKKKAAPSVTAVAHLFYRSRRVPPPFRPTLSAEGRSSSSVGWLCGMFGSARREVHDEQAIHGGRPRRACRAGWKWCPSSA